MGDAWATTSDCPLYAVLHAVAAKGRAHLTENTALKPGIDTATAAVSETLLKSACEVQSMAIVD